MFVYMHEPNRNQDLRDALMILWVKLEHKQSHIKHSYIYIHMNKQIYHAKHSHFGCWISDRAICRAICVMFATLLAIDFDLELAHTPRFRIGYLWTYVIWECWECIWHPNSEHIYIYIWVSSIAECGHIFCEIDITEHFNNFNSRVLINWWKCNSGTEFHIKAW